MMKKTYIVPECFGLEAGAPQPLCASEVLSDDFTDDYTGYDPWNDLTD